jgi:hypothetical protein
MFGSAYAYGHLIPIAVSSSMAVAFVVLALRVPDFRDDLVYAGTALLAAATAGASMLVALRPSLVAARVLFAVAIALYTQVAVLWHVQFAVEVLGRDGAARHRRALLAYTMAGLALVCLVATGAFDDGTIRRVELAGARSAVISMPGWAAAILFAFAVALVPLSARLLAARGPRRRERRSCLPIMLAGPPLGGHELLVAIGVSPLVPLGAYVAGLSSLQGIFVLAERFRALTQREQLGPYEIERRLGEGGMAEVFVATRRGSGRLAPVAQRVALKRLRPEYHPDGTVARLLIEEARTLARLSHPNIVSLLDAGSDEGRVFLALELVEGASLAQILDAAAQRGEPLGADAAIEVGAQAAGALAAAHSVGVVHRDVSPQNLLVDTTGTVKLADFGIARSLEAERTTGSVKGKLPYVAPERLRGEPYDHRVDLYGLGVVLYEIAAGVLPYEGESVTGPLRRVSEARIALLRKTAGAAAPMIERLLAFHPDDRFDHAAELARALAPLRAPSARASLALHVGTARSLQMEHQPTRRLED